MIKITAWDADFIPFFVCHNKKDSGILEKTLDDCIRICDELIHNVNKATKADTFVGFITRGKCFRYSVYPEYKANRKYDALPKYLNDVRAYMIDKYGFVGAEGYEADDLVLSYKKRFDNVTIVSPDKDILKLEGKHYNPRLNKFITTTKKEELEYFWTSMLVGDSADNIKGCKGVGPKTAEAIIKNAKDSSLREEVLKKYCEVYGEYDGIIEFYKYYRCLHILDDISEELLNNVKLNKIEVLSE